MKNTVHISQAFLSNDMLISATVNGCIYNYSIFIIAHLSLNLQDAEQCCERMHFVAHLIHTTLVYA